MRSESWSGYRHKTMEGYHLNDGRAAWKWINGGSCAVNCSIFICQNEIRDHRRSYYSLHLVNLQGVPAHAGQVTKVYKPEFKIRARLLLCLQISPVR